MHGDILKTFVSLNNHTEEHEMSGVRDGLC
jgi:hypothetical protein